MYVLTRPIRFTALMLAAFALTSCASIKVKSFVERGADFARYRTYNWAATDGLETGDPRLDNNPFFLERVQADVEKELAARGFEKTATGADLLIHFHASVSQQIEINSIDAESGNCAGTDTCRPFVYDAGTLMLDLIDTRTDKLVWRGWAEDSMDGAIDNQRLMEQEIDRAVTKILERLPRRL